LIVFGSGICAMGRKRCWMFSRDWILTMTTEPGVAQRMIAEIRKHYDEAGTDEIAQAHGNQMAGVIALHDELSRDARAAIKADVESEIDEWFSDYAHIAGDDDDELSSDFRLGWRLGQQRLAHRLGLTLTEFCETPSRASDSISTSNRRTND
jgi:hypothetical protein